MSSEYSNYIVIRGFTIEDLEKAVNAHMRNGCVPIGGIAEVYAFSTRGRERCFAQAMVRKIAVVE